MPGGKTLPGALAHRVAKRDARRPPSSPAPGRGATPVLPFPPPSGLGPARPASAPARLPASDPSPAPAARPRPEEGWVQGLGVPQTSCKFTPTPFTLIFAAGRQGPRPPAPPVRLHKGAEQPPLARVGGRGARAPRSGGRRRSGHAQGARGGRAAGRGPGWRGGWRRALSRSLPNPHPHLPPASGTRENGVAAPGSGAPALGAPRATPHPSPAHLTLKVSPSGARAPRFRQLVPSWGARPASCARRPLPGSSGSAPPGGSPGPPCRRCRPRRGSLRPARGRRLRCHRAPSPGARAPAVTPRPLPAAPGRGQHPPPAPWLAPPPPAGHGALWET